MTTPLAPPPAAVPEEHPYSFEKTMDKFTKWSNRPRQENENAVGYHARKSLPGVLCALLFGALVLLTLYNNYTTTTFTEKDETIVKIDRIMIGAILIMFAWWYFTGGKAKMHDWWHRSQTESHHSPTAY